MKSPAASRSSAQATKGQLAQEAQDDRGLERLDLGQALGLRHRAQRHGEQGQEDHELERAQPLVQPERHRHLRHPEASRRPVRQLLERPERAQPAAERAPAPEDQRHRDIGPEHEDQGLEQEEVPAEASAQRVTEGQHVDDRELGRGVPADPEQGEQEEADPQPRPEPPPPRQPSWKKKTP